MTPISKLIHPLRRHLEGVPDVLAGARKGYLQMLATLGDLWPLSWKAAAWRAVDQEGLEMFQEGRRWEREHLDDKIREASPGAAAWLDSQS